MSYSGTAISIPFTAITRSLYLREVEVCVSGATKKMMILASDYYDP
jgi:hypothetical protein